MPQASDELRDRMHERFGNRIGDEGPTKYMRDRGWSINNRWQWIKPTPDHVITLDEWECIEFMMDEWDYDTVAGFRE